MTTPATDTEEYRQRFAALAGRADSHKSGTPPWAWANLSVQDAALLDQALEEFVRTYNHIHAAKLEEVIPRCWRHHPALAEELPVQYWAWWAAHVDNHASIATALDYYNRNLPGFQDRLRTRLLGAGAVSCLKGNHPAQLDRDLADAISIDTHQEAHTGRTDHALRTLRLNNFAAALPQD